MLRLAPITVLLIGFSFNAMADIWIWTDANGEEHLVNSSKPIYTWQDELGKVHYSDTPDHEDAVSVELVWHSIGSTEETETSDSGHSKIAGGNEFPGETEGERVAREQAEAYYCKRARDIYDSYANAPRLYETGSDGERMYLDEKQIATKLAETEDAVAQLCN